MPTYLDYLPGPQIGALTGTSYRPGYREAANVSRRTLPERKALQMQTSQMYEQQKLADEEARMLRQNVRQRLAVDVGTLGFQIATSPYVRSGARKLGGYARNLMTGGPTGSTFAGPGVSVPQATTGYQSIGLTPQFASSAPPLTDLGYGGAQTALPGFSGVRMPAISPVKGLEPFQAANPAVSPPLTDLGYGGAQANIATTQGVSAKALGFAKGAVRSPGGAATIGTYAGKGTGMWAEKSGLTEKMRRQGIMGKGEAKATAGAIGGAAAMAGVTLATGGFAAIPMLIGGIFGALGSGGIKW